MSEQTLEHTTSAPLAATTIDELVQSLASMPPAVDNLHIAAELESRGLTDRMALETFGHSDVFSLANSVSSRLPAVRDDAEPHGIRAKRSLVTRLKTLAHGPLYGLLSLVYPAVFIWLGGRVMLWGLVVATGLGWVWSAGMSTAAHRLRDDGRHRAASRLLRWMVLGGITAALLMSSAVALLGPGGPAMVTFAVAQVGFQLGTAVLVIYGLERRLVLIMLPAIGAGATHLVLGFPAASVPFVLIAGAVSVVGLVGWALYTSAEQVPRSDPPGRVSYRQLAIVLLPGIWYAVICATLLLFTDARFLTARFDLSIGVVPLVLGMGALELRSHRFTEQAAEQMRRLRAPADFGREIWRILTRELMTCFLVLGTLGVGLLAVLMAVGSLTTTGALLVDAHIVLGGALFAGFILANLGLFRPLLTAGTAIVAADIVVTVLWADYFGPHGAVPIFLVSSSALLLILLAVLKVNVGVIYHYR